MILYFFKMSLDLIVKFISSSIAFSAPELYKNMYEITEYQYDDDYIFSFTGKRSGVCIKICIRVTDNVYIKFLYNDNQFVNYHLDKTINEKCIGQSIYYTIMDYFCNNIIKVIDPIEFIQLLAS